MEDDIEGGLGVEKKNICWLFQGEQRMLDCFSQKYCCELMGAIFMLELRHGQMLVPIFYMEVTDIKIKGFGDKGTG